MQGSGRACLFWAVMLVVGLMWLYRIYEPHFRSTSALTRFITSSEHLSAPGVATPNWPKVFKERCPAVVAHFERFPYFTNFTYKFSVLPTEYAVHSVCTLHLAALLAASVGGQLNLHAGSHLSAIIHAGPIPWDDDIDAFLALNKQEDFLRACRAVPDLKCVKAYNALKVSLLTPASVLTPKGWYWPFVDIFVYSMDGSRILEVTPTGKPKLQAYPLTSYFPTKPFYFAGVILFGPREDISLKRYNRSRCVVSCNHHKHEGSVWCRGLHDLDCTTLRQRFPFVADDDRTASNGQGGVLLLPDRNRAADLSTAESLWRTSLESRNEWGRATTFQGQVLSDALPNINAVEVDNSISEQCVSKTQLVVAEFNAERGKHWLYIAELLRPLDADIIILNEMDIGMARTDQQHTTRLLAFSLEMNYAWGVEFVELTRGTKEEQDATQGTHNFLGLHGNAILSRCPIVDPMVYRDPIGDYFSSKSNKINAMGYERRLGGRMALFVRVKLPRTIVAVGAVHKINGFTKEVRTYINSTASGLAVVAGDQHWDYCSSVDLMHPDKRDHYTYPASCTSLGTHRGDIFCSSKSMAVAVAERSFLPCLKTLWGVSIYVSDHAPTVVTLTI